MVKIPTPKFLVFYSAPQSKPDTWKLKLSEAFEKPSEDGEFEWTATVINTHPNHNEGLQKKCKALYDYIRYVGRVKCNKTVGMSTEIAVTEAVDWAIKEKLLEGFFNVC